MARIINSGTSHTENKTGSKFYEPNPKERDRVRANYRRRHKGDKLGEVSSGSLSYYILWNKPTLRESIKDYEKRFNIKIALSNS